MLGARMVKLALGVARLANERGWTDSAVYRAGSKAAKRFFFSSPERVPAGAICIRFEGFRFALPLESSFGYAGRHFEPGTRKVLRELVRPGSVFVDVGANLGLHAISVSRLIGPSGRVFALEPGPDNLEFLRANSTLNGIENIQVMPYAAGRSNTTVQLHLNTKGTLHSLHRGSGARSSKVVDVEQRRLDDLLAAQRVDVVKIDTEGSEMDVLEGMEQVLTANPHVHIVVEWNRPCLEAAGRSFNDLPGWLLQRHFDVQLIEEANGELTSIAPIRSAFEEGTLAANWFGNLLARPRRMGRDWTADDE